MAAMAAQNSQAPPERLGVPSRNPLPLSASQEAQVRDIYYQRVRKQCADEIKGASNPSIPPSLHPFTCHTTQTKLTLPQHSPTAPSAAPSQSPSPAGPNTA